MVANRRCPLARRALKLVSHCTQKTLRGQDIAGRHGGDE